MKMESDLDQSPDQDYLEDIQIGEVYIDMYTPIFDEYRKSLLSVTTLAELLIHCERWSKMSYELTPLAIEFNIEDLPLWLEFRDSDIAKQENMIKEEKIPIKWCSFIIPVNFLPYMNIAARFHIPDGLALLRLFHGRLAYLDKEGFLRYRSSHEVSESPNDL
jgi:hypothetical protein